MNKLLSLLTLTSLILAISCAPEAPKTKAKVSIGALTSLGMAGGVYIMARSTSGGSFNFKVPDTGLATDQNFEVEIPNGTWDFRAVGYIGPNNFEGAHKCDFLPGINLDGTETSINIVLDTANCGLAAFGEDVTYTDEMGNTQTVSPITTNQFSQLRFNSCFGLRKEIQNLDFGKIGQNAPICSENPGRFQSFKIIFKDILGTDTESVCVQRPVPGDPDALSNVALPMIGGDFVVLGFDDTACSLNPRAYNFNGGIGGKARNSSNIVTALTRPYKAVDARIDIVLTLNSFEMCQNNALTPYANGALNNMVSSGHNYICNAAQFENIDSMGSFIQLQNIDFAGSTAIVAGASGANTFSGTYFGNNLELRNINNTDSSIFQQIGNGAAIADVKIINAQITGASPAVGVGYGVLVGNAENNFGIANIKIDSTSRIDFDTVPANSNNNIGSVIGSIFSGTNDNFIDNLISEAEVRNDPNVHTGATGGLIGRYQGPTGTGRSRLSNSSFHGSVYSNGKIGGAIGQTLNSVEFNSINVHSLNNTNITLTATGSIVGGLIGSSQQGTEVLNSKAKVSIVASSLTNSFGGLIGSATGGDYNNSHSELTINLPTGRLTSVGGLIGDLSNTGNGTVYNCSSEMSVTMDGGISIGGLIGSTDAPSTFNTNISLNHVTNTTIDTTSGTQPGQKLGGLIGDMNNNYLFANMNLVHEVIIKGNRMIGGLVGSMTSNPALFDESYTNPTITVTADPAGTEGYATGGLIGYTAMAPANISNLYSKGSIHFEGATAPARISKAIGFMNNFNITNGTEGTISKVVSDTSLTYNVSTAFPTQHYSYGFDGTNDFGFTSTVDDSKLGACISCTAPGALYYQVSPTPMIKMPFLDAWSQFGGLSIPGNMVKPFLLTSRADWNKVGNDKLLLLKSYKLANNIDFSNLATTPWGFYDAVTTANSKPFRGVLIPDGKILSNINVTPGTSDALGLFSHAESSSIGLFDDPLRIQNIAINASATTNVEQIGLVGNGANIRIHAIVEGGNYTSTANQATAGLVGGLVGYCLDCNIEKSSFKGLINTPDFFAVGGLAGEFSTSGGSGNSLLAESFAKASFTSSYNVGGLVGSMNLAATTQIYIDDSYYDSAGQTINYNTFSAIVNQFTGTGAGVFMDYNFADLLSGTFNLALASNNALFANPNISGSLNTFAGVSGGADPLNATVNTTITDMANEVKTYSDSRFVFPQIGIPRLKWDLCGYANVDLGPNEMPNGLPAACYEDN
jgi:hypothetical protein